ncbi:hypothetical protein PR001_g8777 [Phytophthora rubi]|uniref:Proteasome activator complex subunit 4 C-terminal domain-containing protein n=1 Tax=Phytophthora rubi TaxID=129364 RepID=A0A6A3MZD1_9STRA|nr:hypothetical protein PR001_g8777 [Phytophthora rubi]
MAATCAESLVKEGDAPVHPYYSLLPSYVTPESVQEEREDFLRRIQETLTCLQTLSDENALDSVLQNRHFRDVDTFYKLKHELPVELHAQLIRVLVGLLWTRDGRAFTDVDMEIRAVKTLQLLLRKWKKRHRGGDGAIIEDLVIEWRSVRRAIERVCFRAPGCIQQASQSYLAKLATTTVKCAEEARGFFRPSDPAVPLVLEMWTEFGAAVKNVKSTEFFRALALFSFLFSLSKSDDMKTKTAVVDLLPQWFSTWSLISRCNEWDGHWMKILSRSTKRYPSTSMLDDYFPFIFAKVNDLLELPSDLGSPFKKQLWPSAYTSINGSKRFGQHAMRLCVYLMREEEDDSRDGDPMRYLLEILGMMKSFFHPSNVANAGNSLATYVYYLSNALGRRLGHEKAASKGLQPASVGKLVDVLMEICLLGIYSKNKGVSTKCMYVMKNLLCIDPVRCVAPVMQEILKALDPMAMSHSHLAVTAISSMSVFLYHLMCGRHPQSTGLFFANYLEPMLKLTLPGIDANDEKKTQSTVQLYFHLLSWLPLVNDPAKGNFQATKQRGQLSNQLFAGMASSMFAEIAATNGQIDEGMWEAGPFLEEWAFAVLDRCFQFIQSRSGARSASPATNTDRNRGNKSSKRDGSEDAIVLQVLNLLAILYAQMSPEIYTQCLRKTVSFVSSAFYTSSFGGKVISTLIFNCMQGNPSEAIEQFMPIILDKFRVTKAAIHVSNLMVNEKVWYLCILDGLVRFSPPDDPILLRYQLELKLILAHFLNGDDEKEVYEAAGAVLQNLLSGLFGVYTHDFRSLPDFRSTAIVKHVDSEADKSKLELKLQAFFLSLLLNWRYIRGQKAAQPLLEAILEAEPSKTEHWKFQLLHLVMLYPFLQPEAMPIDVGIWKLVIRQLGNEVLPVRQIALELFKQLMKLLKRSREEECSPYVEAVDELIYSGSTAQALVEALVNNHKNSNRFAASADGQHADSAPSDWSFGVNEVVRYISNSTQSFPKASPLSFVRLLNQARNTFTNVSLDSAKLVQKLVQGNLNAFLKSGVMELLRDLVSKNIGVDVGEEDRQAALKTLADCIVGMLHALAKLETDDEKAVVSHVTSVVSLLKATIPHVSIVLVDQWVEVVYLASRPSRSNAVKLHRLEPLVSYLLLELEDSFARAAAEDYARQAKWLALVEAVGVHLLAADVPTSDQTLHALGSEFSERVMKVVRDHALAHQYKIIRDRAGKMLFLLGACTFSVASCQADSSPTPLALSSMPLGELLTASASDDNIDSEKTALEGSTGTALNDTSLHAKETAMQWLACCEKYGDGRDMLVVLDDLLPVALLSQSHPKAEVAVQAKNVADAVSLSLRMYFVPQDASGKQSVNRLLELLKRLSTSQTLKTRGAVLRFTMTFAFYHWTFFSSDLKEQVHAFVCTFLTDEQREVQAMAKYDLRGLLHNEDPGTVEEMSVRMTESARQARVKFPKLKRRCERLKAESASEEELTKVQEQLKGLEAKMTESVLSLSAVVLAFPHDVPSFVPPIFEELGRFLYMKRSSNTISFLEKAVKETLLDFKRTHQDNWIETKTKFSPAQLDVIEDVAIAPSYFS